MHGDARLARLGDVHLVGVTGDLRDEPFVATSAVAAQCDGHPRVDGAVPRHGARAEEQLRRRTVRDRRAGLCHPGQFGVGAVDAVGQNGAPSEQALAADSRTGEKLAVVGVEVALHVEELLDQIDLTGTGPIVLVEMRVDVDAAVAYLRVQLAERREGLCGHRQREARHDRGEQSSGVGISGVGCVPSIDLGGGQCNRIGLRGHQRGSRVRTLGLDTATADDAQSGALGRLEQFVLRHGESRTEHHCSRGARGDPGAGEVARDRAGEHRVGQS